MPPTELQTPKVHREAALAGMRCVDTSGNPRIPVLMEMVGALSRAVDPQEVLRVFSTRIEGLYAPQGYVSLSTRGLEPGQYKITRRLDLDGADTLGSADPWQKWDHLPVHSGGFFGEIIRTAYPELIHHLSIRDDAIVGDSLAEYRSLMAIPLFDDGEPLNWAIFLRKDPEGFSVEELEQAILRANLVGTTVKSALIAKELREAHARIRAEVDRVAAIQRTLLPDPLPTIPGLSIVASYQTFDQAGGDHYDFRPLRPCDAKGIVGGSRYDPRGPWGMLIADASGHGPAAAVVMAMLHAIVEAYPHEPSGPAEVLAHANRHLVAKRIEHSFVTAFFAIYDPVSRRLAYARAGHNPPLVMRGGGQKMVRLDDVGGLPLGITDDVVYEEVDVQLEPGETLVLYTDGITEARSPDGRFFGIKGIEASLGECSGEPTCVIQHVSEALRTHQAGARPTDDQTIVAVQVEEEGTEGPRD